MFATIGRHEYRVEWEREARIAWISKADMHSDIRVGQSFAIRGEIAGHVDQVIQHENLVEIHVR